METKPTITLSPLGFFLKDGVLIKDLEALELWDSIGADWSQGAFQFMAVKQDSIRNSRKMEMFQERMEKMMKHLDSMTPLELAHEMQSCGMKFKEPLPELK